MTTWDGLPVAAEPPFTVCVVVWRAAPGGRELLVLHRAHSGPEHEGDWAWTPPSGARQPGEMPEQAAARELLEETGLVLELVPCAATSPDVALFSAEAPRGTEVILDAEHDRCAWVAPEDALARCLPSVVAAGIESVLRSLVLATA